MKKECNLFRLLVKALALYAAEIILVIGVVAGVFYAVGFVSELFSGAADLETGILVLFTIAGMALFIDFKRGGNSPVPNAAGIPQAPQHTHQAK